MKLRNILAIYEKNEDLVSIGAYQSGSNAKLDYALRKIDSVNEFLKQGVYERFSREEMIEQMQKILTD